MDSDAVAFREFSEESLLNSYQVCVGWAVLLVVTDGFVDRPGWRLWAWIVAVAGKDVPMQMRLEIPQTLIVELSGLETAKHGFGNKTHLDEEPLARWMSQVVDFRHVFFA